MVERIMRIELTSWAWKAYALPLCYIRIMPPPKGWRVLPFSCKRKCYSATVVSTAVESPVVVSVVVVSPAVVCSVVGSVSVGTGSVVLVSHAVMAAIINMAKIIFFITY